MSKMELPEIFHTIFVPNRKCITNADLDGILAGMLLQKFLNWEIVGYSYCAGKKEDTLWLKNKDENLEDCVFVDLPVCMQEYSVIDQHFVARNNTSIQKYNAHKNKVNPNIMRGRVLEKDRDYNNKYPFGTAHFILAVLENLGKTDASFELDLSKKSPGCDFDLADLILRADGAIDNANKYPDNCKDWAEWLISIGGKNTEALFSIVKREAETEINRREAVRAEAKAETDPGRKAEINARIWHKSETERTGREKAQRKAEVKFAEIEKLGKDGGCEQIFREKDKERLKKYLDYLGTETGLPVLEAADFYEYGNLTGERYNIVREKCSGLKAGEKYFSYAYVSKEDFSYTKMINC